MMSIKRITKIFFYNKTFTFINLGGLITAISSVMLIYFFISSEYNYDSFHKDAERIYRVSVINEIKDKGRSEGVEFLEPMAPAMKNEIPEIEECTRISTPRSGLIEFENKHFNIDNVCYADSAFINIFTYALLSRNNNDLLDKPFTALITKETSERLFGVRNPVGLQVNFNDTPFEITGILENPPRNSHIQFNMLLSFSSLYKMKDISLGWNGGNQYITYAKLHKENNFEAVNKKLKSILWKNLNEKLKPYGWKFTAYLQPLKDIHLKYSGANNPRLINVYVFSAVGLLILLLACINYINLSIAGSLKRSKETGIRKALGASRFQLLIQFMVEFSVMIFTASVISVICFYLIMPQYKKFIGNFFSTEMVININSILFFIVLVAAATIIISIYPAFYLSKITPVAAINHRNIQYKSRLNIKNALILFQFVISIAMISSTLIISSQLSFIKNRDTGYNREDIFVIKLNSTESRQKSTLLKNEILKLSEIRNVTVSSQIPVNGLPSNGYLVEGQNASDIINVVDVDKNFLNTYGIKVIEGRNFSDNFGTDKDAYLVNEEFVKQYSLKNPLGKKVDRNYPHKIIGVVSDFNFASAREKISPLIITNEEYNFNYLSIRINSSNITKTVGSISNLFKEICPGTPFEFMFLDETIAGIYRDEMNFRTLFFFFSGISIVISIIGLLGLTIFLMNQKRKEIGIRKVLGASVFTIIKLAYKEYLLIIMIALVIASLLSMYFINKWLDNFAFRIDVSLWLFIMAGLIAVIISFITVAGYSIKAATANPVQSLKYE